MDVRRRWVVFAVALLGLPSGAVQAATLNVAAGAVAIVDDGTCSIREAMVNANDDATTHDDCPPTGAYGADTVVLANNATYTFTDGAFAADGNNALPPVVGILTIDANGSILERDVNAGDFRILRVASNGNLTLEDATVRNGRANGGTVFGNRGGGMLDRGISTIRGCTFVDNFAEAGGGIAYGSSSTAEIIDSTITSNEASAEGGGIFNGEPHVLEISGTTISNNQAANAGGGIMTFHIVNTSCTTITGNDAGNGGGLCLASTGQAQLVSTTVADNDATGTTAFTGNGGGIYAGGNNFNGTGNLGLYVIDSTVSGNRATNDGGGIYNVSANSFLFSSTIAGNRADSDDQNGGTGGGLANTGSSFTAGQSTFTFPGRVNFGNTLLADNSDDGNGADECVDLQQAPLTTQIVSYGNNLIEDPVGCAITEFVGIGTNITGQDPGLPPLTLSPGACSATQCPSAAPAVDGGAVSDLGCAGGVNSLVTVDQRGLPRPVGGVCDIGACEAQVRLDPATAAPALSPLVLAGLCAWLTVLGAIALRREPNAS